MSHPVELDSLTTREAIIDAVHRGVMAWDRNDASLLKSATAGDDVIFELRAGDEVNRFESRTEVLEKIFPSVGAMDTTHMCSNFRVDVKDGADKAFVTCYFLAQHCPPGRGREPDGPKYLVGGEYVMDLVLDADDGLWKVKKWIVEAIWRQGDRSVMGR